MYNNYSKLQSASDESNKKCDSLASFFAELQNLKKEGIILFRGQNDVEYDLIPSIGRKTGRNYNYTKEDERQMFLEFKKNYSLFTDNRPDSDISILFLAQHFGVPTRLLDWSYNPLIALYFACQGSKDVDGSVYAITIPKDNSIIKEDHRFDYNIFDDNVYHHEYEYIIPDYTNRRFLNQKGMFLLFRDPFTPIDKDSLSPVYRITDKQRIIKELSGIGITDSMVLPTLDKLGEEIAKKYRRC